MRIRITFAKTDLIRYIGHLDLYHIWIRTFRRAHLPVWHSQGFHPQPKIQLASALSLGYTGSNELMECWLEAELPLDEIKTRLISVRHPGIQINSIEGVDENIPPLQVRICGSHYRVSLPTERESDLSVQLQNLLTHKTLNVVRKGKQINIRPLIFAIDLDEQKGEMTLHLSGGESATGRVDEVLSLLGLDPLDCLVERTGIDLREPERSTPPPESVYSSAK